MKRKAPSHFIIFRQSYKTAIISGLVSKGELPFILFQDADLIQTEEASKLIGAQAEATDC